MSTQKSQAPSDAVRLIESQISELQERLKVEHERDACRARLIRFLHDHPILGRRDVLIAMDIATPKAKRGKRPVTSRRAHLASRVGKAKDKGKLKPAVGPIGKAVRAAREAAGLTISELAEKLHVAHASIAGWEQGKWKPSKAKATALGRALNKPARQS